MKSKSKAKDSYRKQHTFLNYCTMYSTTTVSEYILLTITTDKQKYEMIKREKNIFNKIEFSKSKDEKKPKKTSKQKTLQNYDKNIR